MKKIPPHLAPYVMKEDESACAAFYRLSMASLYGIILVVDDQERLVGILTLTDMRNLPRQGLDPEAMSVGQVCNRKFKFLRDSEDKYLYGRNIFAELPIDELPILNDEHIPVGLFARWQAFFKDYFDGQRLTYPYYAVNILAAAKLAREKGYDKISVIEFGVAGGTGLRHCELFAKEAEKLSGVGIEVYGFDSGQGLFAPRDHRDMPHHWAGGEYKMQMDKLQDSLLFAKLIIGDICETTKTFLADYNPAPIGVMLVDVDQYTPTVAILDMLLAKDENFLPLVFMYFDDIWSADEFLGETLAVKEFNQRSQNAKISPENLAYNPLFPAETGVIRWASKLKICHRFTHEKFAKTKINKKEELPIRY